MTRSNRRLGIDLGCIVPGSSGGVANVIAGAIPELVVQRPDLEFVAFCTPANSELVGSSQANLRIVTFPSEAFYPELDAWLATQTIDVLFRAYPTVEQIAFPLERQIVLIPDLLHDLRPGFFDPDVLANRREAFRRPLAGSGALATISEYSRSTIVAEEGRTSDTFIMYPSVSSYFEASSSAKATTEERALVPTGEFFLYPANLWPHKNHKRLLEALERCRALTQRPIELVFTGALDGWDELIEGSEPGMARHLGYVSEPLLRLLYEQALALTFFSLHEGFGIPVLEAFAVGTPVLCGNGTSLPEVAGDAALMCNPLDIEAMADLMTEIASSSTLRAFLVQRGRERTGRFSWSRAAAELGAAIDRVEGRAEAA